MLNVIPTNIISCNYLYLYAFLHLYLKFEIDNQIQYEPKIVYAYKFLRKGVIFETAIHQVFFIETIFYPIIASSISD